MSDYTIINKIRYEYQYDESIQQLELYENRNHIISIKNIKLKEVKEVFNEFINNLI